MHLHWLGVELGDCEPIIRRLRGEEPAVVSPGLGDAAKGMSSERGPEEKLFWYVVLCAATTSRLLLLDKRDLSARFVVLHYGYAEITESDLQVAVEAEVGLELGNLAVNPATHRRN